MKQIFSFLSLLAITLIGTYFAFNLNKEYVDLRYTLSEKIPTKFIETSPAESVQQLVVKNNGNMLATKIQIKIDGVVKDQDILKSSASDIVEEHKSNDHFEAIYPSLPPDAQFSYIFKTSGGGISKNNLEITHNKGKAKEALAGESQIYKNIGSYLFLSVFIFYVIMFAIQARSMAIDHLESKGSYTNYHDYLNKNKPIYVSQEKWDSLRRKYIEGKIKPCFLDTTNIEEEENYKILNQEKPKFLTEDEWELLKEKASKSFEDQLTYLIKTSRYSHFEKYFLVIKPKHFPEIKWQAIVKEINDNFISIKKLDKEYSLTAEKILKELELGPPSGMLPEFWDKYNQFLTDRYFDLVYSEILSHYNPLGYLKDIRLSVLNKNQQKKLEDISYKIQLLDIDQIASLGEAEKFLKKDKPDWIKDSDWEKLEKKAEEYIEFKKAAQKVEEDKLNLESEKQKTNELKDKVLKQLSIIDDVFINPESIDKIEDYDNPFSEGNFANLRKISKFVQNE